MEKTGNPTAIEGCHNGTCASACGRTELADCRILLVEEHSEDSQLVKHVLEQAGARVDVADNGQLAIDMIAAVQGTCVAHDLVLMDVRLPVLSGYEVVRRLRADGLTLPVIALTAHAMEGDREKRLQAGFNDHVLLPIDRTLLVEKIHCALRVVANRN